MPTSDATGACTASSRTNLTESDPAKLWEYYLQLVAVEEAFKTLKGDLAIRPIYHQRERRIEAHFFIAFLAYYLHVTLGHRLKHLAPGLTTRSVLEKFCAVQMIDVHVPIIDGRELTLTRYTQPAPELKLETADRFAAAAPAKNHRRSGRFRHPRVVQTLGGHPSMNQQLAGVNYFFRRVASRKIVTGLPHAKCYPRIIVRITFRRLAIARSAASAAEALRVFQVVRDIPNA
jgi:hypothetical protein